MITEDDVMVRVDLLDNTQIFSARGYINSNLDFKVPSEFINDPNYTRHNWFIRQYVKWANRQLDKGE